MVWDSSWQQPGIKENTLGMARIFGILKSPETPLWTKAHLLILPEQFHLMGPCLHVSLWRPCWSTPSSHRPGSLHLKEARCNRKLVWNAKSQSTPNLLKQKQKQNRVQAGHRIHFSRNLRKPVFYKRFNDAIPIPSCSVLRWDQIQTNQAIN